MTLEEIIKPENKIYGKTPLLTETPMHYCPGCSHELGRKSIEAGNKVLEIDPNDTNAKKINEAIERIM